MTEMELRQNFVAFMLLDAGAVEGGTVHQQIVRDYNCKQSKLPRGYELKLRDAWCAGYVSAKAIQYNLLNYIPSEVSCAKMVEKAKAMGIWHEEDDYKDIKPADIVLYDWEDDGKGDNTGSPNHVGYVIYRADGYLGSWEGNFSKEGYPDHVGVRPIRENGKFIRGFITPRYDAAAQWLTWLEEQKCQTTEKAEEDEEENNMRYKTLEEVREKAGYGTETVEKLVASGILLGTGGDAGLNLSEDLLRTLVVLDRLGLIPDTQV